MHPIKCLLETYNIILLSQITPLTFLNLVVFSSEVFSVIDDVINNNAKVLSASNYERLKEKLFDWSDQNHNGGKTLEFFGCC